MTKKLIYTSRAVFANVCNTLIYSVLQVIGGGKSCDLTLCKRTFYQPFHHIGVLCLLGMAPFFVSCGKDIPSEVTRCQARCYVEEINAYNDMLNAPALMEAVCHDLKCHGLM